MKTLRTTTTALLVWAVWGAAQAGPLTYTSSRFATDAVALAGSVAESDSKTSPPDGLPLVSSAIADGGANLALAVGLADNGLLVAQSEASSANGATSAVGAASFDGMFSMTGPGYLQFWIDLVDQDFTDAGQFSDASLFVRLTFQGATYADLLLTGADDPFFLQVTIPGAGTGVFSLVLSSEANALGGNAANFAQAEFRADVPEPGTLALLLGAGLVGGVARPRREARARTTA